MIQPTTIYKACCIYSVGPDSLSEEDFDAMGASAFVWIVYWYEGGSWDGAGLAIWRRRDNHKIYWENLGHDSCDGPGVGALVEGGITRGEVEGPLTQDVDAPGRTRSPSDYDFKRWVAVGQAVRAVLRLPDPSPGTST